MSDFGDITQKYGSYDAANNKATGLVPDFTVSGQQPTIEVYLSDSRKTNEVYPNSAKWSAGNMELSFDVSTGLSTTMFNGESGHFKVIPPVSGKTRAGLKIVKNLVVAFGAMPVQIDCTVSIAEGSGSSKISQSYTIPVMENTTGGNVVRISATNGGILNKEHSQVILTANIDSSGGATVTSPEYKWEATDENGEFKEFSPAQTGKSLTVDQGMVDNSRLFRLTVVGIGSDIQDVEDHTDELRVVPNPDPADQNIHEGSGEKVVWSPEMYRGDTKIAAEKIAWSMKFYNPAGTPIPTKTPLTMTEEEIAQNGGANYIISGVVQR